MNRAYSHAIFKLLYLDDSKIGQIFKDLFGPSVPHSAVAIVSATVSLYCDFKFALTPDLHSSKIFLRSMKWTEHSAVLTSAWNLTIRSILRTYKLYERSAIVVFTDIYLIQQCNNGQELARM